MGRRQFWKGSSLSVFGTCWRLVDHIVDFGCAWLRQSVVAVLVVLLVGSKQDQCSTGQSRVSFGADSALHTFPLSNNEICLSVMLAYTNSTP